MGTNETRKTFFRNGKIKKFQTSDKERLEIFFSKKVAQCRKNPEGIVFFQKIRKKSIPGFESTHFF